jgi:hypothetical protein
MFFRRKKSPEQILKETPLKEAMEQINPTPDDYQQAEEEMLQFETGNSKELETNSLELDKHMISISGGGIVLLIAFLSLIERDGLPNLSLKILGVTSLLFLGLCVISIIATYFFAVERGKNSVGIVRAHKELYKHSKTRPQDAAYWERADLIKNDFADLVGISRKWNGYVVCFNRCGQLCFIIGIASLCIFGIVNIMKFSNMQDEEKHPRQSNETSERVERASEVPSVVYDQLIDNTMQMLQKPSDDKESGK